MPAMLNIILSCAESECTLLAAGQPIGIGAVKTRDSDLFCQGQSHQINPPHPCQRGLWNGRPGLQRDEPGGHPAPATVTMGPQGQVATLDVPRNSARKALPRLHDRRSTKTSPMRQTRSHPAGTVQSKRVATLTPLKSRLMPLPNWKADHFSVQRTCRPPMTPRSATSAPHLAEPSGPAPPKKADTFARAGFLLGPCQARCPQTESIRARGMDQGL